MEPENSAEKQPLMMIPAAPVTKSQVQDDQGVFSIPAEEGPSCCDSKQHRNSR